MAYKPHYLVQFGGALYGSEIWSCSFRMANALGTMPAPIDTVLDDLLGDVKAFINTATFSQAVTLNFVKMNPIDELGHYADKTRTYERILSGTGTGLLNTVSGTGGSFPPPQCAIVASLRTNRLRGVGSAGRFYLPAPTAVGSVGSNGLLPIANRDAVQAAVHTFLQNVNNWPGIDNWTLPYVVVASPGGKNQLEGLNEKVTGVGVGRVVDTVRRRRNDLNDDFTLTTVS